MSKHTPGPWHFHKKLKDGGFRIDGAGDNWQWFAEAFQAPGFEDEGEANARLIAAAPEMLEALQSLDWGTLTAAQIKLVQGALDKAEGK